MGHSEKTESCKRYLKAFIAGVLYPVRILLVAITALSLMVIGSFLSYPYLSKDLCVVDSRFGDRTESINKVIDAFNRNGIAINMSCKDLTSVKLKYSDIPNPIILAQTMPYAIGITYYNTNRLGYEHETYQIFVPSISIYRRLMEFNTYHKEMSSTEFELTFTHEIGHYLGAPHIYTDGSHIMSPYITLDMPLDQAVLQIKDLTNSLQRY